MELMTAIAAAAFAPTWTVAIAQKGPVMDSAPIIPTVIPPITNRGSRLWEAAARAIAATNAEIAICHGRSLARSDHMPTRTIAIAVRIKGIVATTPVAK